MFSDVNFDFSGRAAIVTGVGSPKGIGRAIFRGFAEAGAHVAGCDIDDDQLSVLRREEPDAFVKNVDVRDKRQVSDFVGEVAARYGHIDILVNNAGIAPFCPLIDLDEATWDVTFDTNVKGYFLFAQAVARHMIAQGRGGNIVNVTSVSVHESGEHKAHYCASKAAVGSLTKGLALELARYGIRVNAVEPGAVDTLIVKDAYLAGLMESLKENPGTPINRLADGLDMVGAVLFLCSEAADYMTGSSILVDGGGLAGSQMPDAVLREYENAKTDRIKKA
ncbi:MAG: SDR family NAD(P)-dependent oxidoreductase [Chloroflexi bacterium]|nr:SDR family NAD(P)-dependent oxidoreductase [Chloroflexota bacterium]